MAAKRRRVQADDGVVGNVGLVGLVGLGDMGCCYADVLLNCGRAVIASPGRTGSPRLPELRARYADRTLMRIVDDGALVVREADFIVFSVETAHFEAVLKRLGPSVKMGAVVLGQCSVKKPEVDAFDRWLPPDVSVLPCHSLHGPKVATTGQTLALIRHRCSDDKYGQAYDLFNHVFGYRVREMTASEHDTITADTQVLTHLGFEAMGTAWKAMESYPWETPAYVGGIDNIKVLSCLRIYASKPHVYSALAMFNPRAREQVRQYNKSVAELFKLMITGQQDVFQDRITKAKKEVFGAVETAPLLPDSLLQEFSLNPEQAAEAAVGSVPPLKRNSHLSILAMVDSWHQLGIRPYTHLACETPVFRLRLGIAEYLFRDTDTLFESCATACTDKSILADDFEFVTAVREWSTIISHGDMAAYERQFEETRSFFSEAKLAQGMRLSSQLIAKLRATPRPSPARAD
eukprot:TRINITY_DN30810_c0_g1_i1.p1 TRINITY_DN30810_c0_g1~~TRINITY_DN30810_c0_g1_i1.p1  ORF type:complete len:482 (+),score=135.72 TRINITY_DN30810_c0_g1_i1:64-1446(+)